MSVELVEQQKLILKRFLEVAYGLSDADVEMFLRILKTQEGKDVDTISKELNISKSRASLILKKLNDAGLIEKQKMSQSKGGRPKYVYYVNKSELKDKLSRRADELCKSLADMLKSL
ncbi:MAG: helix-turn-helix domain-containing protein [Sulfolobaceae archaeon]